MKTVLVYRNDLLPLSEVFIKEQVMALRDWRPVLVGRRVLDQLPLDDLDIRIVDQQQSAQTLIGKIRRAFGIVSTRTKRELEAENPQLVHAHFGTDALDAWPISRALDLPMLVTLHGYDINIRRQWWEEGNLGLRMRSYPRRLLQLAQQSRVTFTAVSHALRRRAIEFGIPPQKIQVNYIGIDVRKFRPAELPIAQRPPHVLFVGRLVEKKGCRYLIEAMSRLLRG